MITLLLFQVALLGVKPVPDPLPMSGESRTYHGVSIAQLKETKWTHVAVCGRVEYVKQEEDGDAHLRLSDGRTSIVAEIVPYHRLPIPRVGQFARVAGISREDKAHHWYEVNPVEAISIVGTCKTWAAGSSRTRDDMDY